MKLKMPKMPKMPKMDKFLNNKNVLYAVFVVAILNLLGYLMLQNTEAVVFFLIIGFLTTYFSKNMTVVLIVAIVSTSIFASTRNTVKEGMASKKDSKNDDKKEESEKDHTKSDDEEEEDVEDDLEGMEGMKTKSKVDYASTMEQAYTNLQKSVGKDGIEGLTNQTKNLLDQQKQLMDNINGMQPFIKTAEKFMSNLDMSSLEGLGGMLGKLTDDKNKNK